MWINHKRMNSKTLRFWESYCQSYTMKLKNLSITKRTRTAYIILLSEKAIKSLTAHENLQRIYNI